MAGLQSQIMLLGENFGIELRPLDVIAESSTEGRAVYRLQQEAYPVRRERPGAQWERCPWEDLEIDDDVLDRVRRVSERYREAISSPAVEDQEDDARVFSEQEARRLVALAVEAGMEVENHYQRGVSGDPPPPSTEFDDLVSQLDRERGCSV